VGRGAASAGLLFAQSSSSRTTASSSHLLVEVGEGVHLLFVSQVEPCWQSRGRGLHYGRHLVAEMVGGRGSSSSDSHWNILHHLLSSEQQPTMIFKLASLTGLAVLSALLVTVEAAAAASGDKDKKHGVCKGVVLKGVRSAIVRGLQGGISFPGGVCPAIPAGLSPVLSTPPLANDGWTLALDYNDDDSSSQDLTSDGLSFSLSLFGTLYNKVFINNNGNLSFGHSLFLHVNWVSHRGHSRGGPILG